MATSFVFTWPMWMLIEFRSDGVTWIPSVIENDRGWRGIPLFTEELLAERCRNASFPVAEIRGLQNIETLRSYIEAFDKQTEATHVTIDHDESNKQAKSYWIEFQDV